MSSELYVRDEAAEAENPWASSGARFSIALNVVTGLFFGIAIGFQPVMFQFNTYLADCSRYTNADTCNALTNAKCTWYRGACHYPDYRTVNCSHYGTQDSCKAASDCFWRYHDSKCEHNQGWTSSQQGLIAGMQILGAMLSSPTAGPLTNKLGRRKSIVLCGIVGIIACAMLAAGWAAKETYPVIVVAQLLLGLAAGWTSVICPMYCGEMSARAVQNTIGVLYQVAITLGIAICAATGLALSMEKDTNTPHDHLQERLQFVLIWQWVTAFGILPIAFLMPESTLWLQEQRQAGAAAYLDEPQPKIQTEGEAAAANTKQPSVNIFQMKYALPICVAIALACGQQLTGINAIMVFGPKLVGAIGLAPLVGNFCIAFWNFLSCVGSIPLVARFPPRVLFIVSSAIATVSCFLTGIAVIPGVFEANSTAQHVLSGIGIATFISAFEIGIGPCFYVLAQDTFPAEVRSAGCSFTVFAQFVGNVMINWGFPVAMTALSGGPSGNQDQGMGICFFMFSGFGALTTAFLGLKMPKANSEREEADAALLGEAQ